jgi:hypothetical protein
MEILLDPRSIQWMLASGGVLLVTGIVIWLASLGIFEHAMVVAVTLGAGTVLMLGAGCWVVRNTSMKLAGQAVTLLACLVMPLNLWFYHSHQLMTLDGNLWIAAVVCCVLYAVTALVLRDPLFVYVLMAGVAGTGLLILSDMGKFAEIAAPSLMLVVMGLIGIHAERAFEENEGPFSRKRFGLAFFFSGHALLAGGLLLLLGAQLTASVLKPIFPALVAPEITTVESLKLLAIGIVLAGSYAYVYSDLVVRRVGFYIYPAAFTLLWAELLGLGMLNLKYGPEAIIATLALTALLLTVAQGLLKAHPRLSRPIVPLATLLCILPVGYGLLLHARATNAALHGVWHYEVGVGYVLAMILTAVTCRLSAHLHRKTNDGLSAAFFFLTAAATMVAAAGLLTVLGIGTWAAQAPILMLIPLAYLLASQFYGGDIQRKSLMAVARVATGVMIFSVLTAATHLSPRVFDSIQGKSLNLLLAVFFAEGAVFYALLTMFRKHSGHVFVATAMACGALWQLLSFAEVTKETYMFTFAVLGLGMLLISRWATVPAKLQQTASTCGKALMSLSFISSALMVASLLLTDRSHSQDARLMGLMMLLMLAGAVIVGKSPWRRTFTVMGIINGALGCLLLGALIDLSGWQKAEIFCVASGLALLVAGHVGWFREQEKRSDTVSFNLATGAVLAGLPLLIASVVNRFGYSISIPDEIALVTVSALMLISGLMLQVRSTTITGGALLALHVAILLGFAGWKAQLAVGVYLSMAGAVVFLLGLGLAIYRERLLELPGRIRRHEGIFKVLAWR